MTIYAVFVVSRFHEIEFADAGTAECVSLTEKPLGNKITWRMTKFSSFEPEMIHLSNESFVDQSLT